MRFPFFFIFILFFSFLFTCPAWANEEFETSYFSTYRVAQDGLVTVDQEIKIKNKLANIFVSEYSLTIGSNQVKYVTVWDDYGAIEPLVESGWNKTKILNKFNTKVVGKGQESHLHIQYQTPDFATINGQILEVNIPALAKKEELTDYQVKLIVPAQFGPPSFIQPWPNAKNETGQETIYFFQKDRLAKIDGISAAFGEVQIYDFTLLYELKNQNNFSGRAQIALPADTAYQQVFYQSIQPEAQQIEVDEDGNWLASYHLNPGEQLNIIATGSAQVYIRPREELKEENLTPEQAQKYLQPAKYWEAQAPQIKKLATELGEPKKIYDYVVNNLIYDYARLDKSPQRLGAASTLEHPQSALCTEFTDLFVALARAAGIPARKIDGFAYTTNPRLRPLASTQDVLHAWPEYYDRRKNLWIPVDPTWGNTTDGVDFFSKLDMNHFAFARQGIKSDSPAPAGAYNLGQNQKNVFVKFGLKKERVKKIDFKPQLPNRIIAGLPIIGTITVVNSGQMAYHHSSVWLKTTDSTQELSIDILPPLATYQIPIRTNTAWNKAKTYNIQVIFAEQQTSFQIQVLPIWQYFWQQIPLWFRQFTKH